MIRPNGINGHMYIGYRTSLRNDDGAILFGLENSEGGEKNLYGRPHDAHARSSPFSPTGGSKEDRIGDELNGREVDLTGLSMDEQVELHNMLRERLDTLLEDDYNRAMEQLSGPKMSVNALVAPLTGPGATDEKKLYVRGLIVNGRAESNSQT